MATEARLATIETISRNPQLNAEEKNTQILKLFEKETPASEESKDAVTSDLTPEQQVALITQNLQETLNPEILEDIVLKQKRRLVVYWGTATTGRPHCAYFVPMLKIASFLRAGCRVKILLADVHGFLDNLKAPVELVKYRAEYYKYIVENLLKAIGVSVDRLEFSFGSSHQLTPEYEMDLFRLSTLMSIHDAQKAGSEVVKQVENATLSGLIYPLMQALDEQYLGVDAQFGGVDQRRIFTMAKDYLPRLGYKPRCHFMNYMVPGLAGGKMSSSEPDSKIDVLDKPEAVTKKIKKAYAVPKEVEGNGLLSFIQYVLLPTGEIRTGKPRFEVERREGEPLVYETVEKLHEDYEADILTPQLLKASVSKALNELLEPVQAAFKASPQWQEIEHKAYPPPPPEPKKQKKVKDRGTRAPNRDVHTQPDGSVEGGGTDQVNVAGSATEAMNELDLGKQNANGA